jgi:hypothetical protein
MDGFLAKCVVFSGSVPGRMDSFLGPDAIGQAPSFSVATSSGLSKLNRWKPFPTTGASVVTWFRSGGEHSMCPNRTLARGI